MVAVREPTCGTYSSCSGGGIACVLVEKLGRQTEIRRRPQSVDGMTSLGSHPPRKLVDARLQLHHAAQIPASFGYTFVEPEPDWSHTALAWSAEHGALVSAEAHGTRAGLRLADATLLLLERDNLAATFSLDGKTLKAGLGWLAETLSEMNREVLDKSLVQPDHELPDHPIAAAASFSLEDAAAFSTLSAWFDFANGRLTEVGAYHAHTTPVLCWPHHFDIARLVLLSAGADAGKSPSVGVGLSPGDDSYAEPYWYVTHWPEREDATLPRLPSGGFWRTEGWYGAVLPGSAFAHLDALALTDGFLSAAISASLAQIR